MSFSIIHLSDIHIKSSSDLIFSKIDKLKAACTSALPANGSVIVIVSGDIAFSGEKQQYQLAEKLLSDITKHIQNEKNSKVDVFCVPGNHDCHFSENSSVRKTLIDKLTPENIDDDYYKAVNCVQNEYNSFEIKISGNKLKELEIDDKKIAVVGVNTSWMSTLEESPGKIIIPDISLPKIDSSKYKIVIYVYHHPDGWLNPDFKDTFINHVREKADIILIGHEHSRDSYEKIGNSFSVYCNHGKELQDSKSEESAFSVLLFDNSFQNFDIVDYKWNGNFYDKITSKTNQYHKNIAINQSVYHPNKKTMDYINDMGITINHFSKDDVKLPDLFVWPDMKKRDYRDETKNGENIRANIVEELSQKSLNILVGSSSIGKTSIAKMLFLSQESKDVCSLLINGKEFTSSEDKKIKEVVEKAFKDQYDGTFIENFNQLEKFKRIVIVDDFDMIKYNNDRRTNVLDYLCNFFGKVTILISSTMELTTIITSEYISQQQQLIYYDILPLGNTKRKEMISKWYHLNELSLSEDEISKRIESVRIQIDTFLGNGAAFIPALPVFILATLQNGDAKTTSYSGSKYSFLYESLIANSFSKVSSNYSEAGMYNIDQSILSKLAFDMLNNSKAHFSFDQLSSATNGISREYYLQLSSTDFLKKMISAKIVIRDTTEGDVYKFKYPYIYYYFAGRYIAYNLSQPEVKNTLKYMSARLYNETFGNIIIFVCHFAGSREVIDDILLNAYGILDDFEAFDFTKSNPIFEEIKEAVDALIPTTVANNTEVIKNKENALRRMDDIGLNDGQVREEEDIIDDDISEKEKEMNAVSSALKTIEVLGQILQNYPVAVKGDDKIEIINEMHRLSMRSVQAIVKTMGYFEQDLIEFVFDRALSEKKNIRKEVVAREARKFINMLISGMARGMIHQVAVSLNSKHILPAAKHSFENDTTISSKLILADLEMNCLEKFSYSEIQNLKKFFEESKETFASRILDSIIAYYLNYHKCDHVLRSKLCSLCGLSENKVFLLQQGNNVE